MVCLVGCRASRRRERKNLHLGLIADDGGYDPENNVYCGRIQLTRVAVREIEDEGKFQADNGEGNLCKGRKCLEDFFSTP